MPAVSPTNITDPTLRFTIKTNGNPIKDFYPVVSINTLNEINRIPVAEVILIDGAVDKSDFPISESTDFVPGTDLEITAGYGSETENIIFKGVIVKHALKIDSSANLNLVITCKHKAVGMTFNKKEAIYSGKKDSDIITTVTGTYGLTVTTESTTIVHEHMFQKLATDWDFMLSRTDFCGFIVSFDADNVKIGKPKLDGTAELRVAFGESIISFNAELNAERQATGIVASAWDISTLAAITSTATEPTINTHGNLSAKSLSAQLSQTDVMLNSSTPMSQAELKEWADSSLLRMRLNALKGQVTFIGNASVKPGGIIELAGVGDRFNGSAFVTSVKHNLENGEWLTTVKFGLDQKPISEQANFSYSPAVGQLPAIHGLQIATVKKLSGDPESQYRIQVTLLSNPVSTEAVWARVGNFYATGDAGSSFLPEVGDEVIVGFLESNPSYPVVLGSLYSSAKTPVYAAADENNYTKAITTKSKLKISFDDEKKITKIETPAGNTVTLNDDAKAIEIVDQNSNSIKMTSSGIEIKSGKDIKLTATGNITLDATGKLNLTSKQDVAVEGLNIANTAKVGFTAKGNATAEISASGQTVVKGGMVMIN